MRTKLAPISEIPTYACIIRATWERGETQAEAVREINARGCWLSDTQLVHAGLTKEQYRALCAPTTNQERSR